MSSKETVTIERGERKVREGIVVSNKMDCLLYTSDAADE